LARLGSIAEVIKRAYARYGPLYPVLVAADGEIVDGRTRKRVDPNWPEVRVDARTPAEKEILAFIANANRREMRGEEISRRLARIKELTGWNARRIARELGRTERWVFKYLPQEYKDPVKVKARKPRRSSAGGSDELSSSPPCPEPLFVENVWGFDGGRGPYGDPNFHGNTDPGIVRECLLKYTEEGETVVDPMTGSGTVADVCAELGRRCLSFDIKPMRPDIRMADASSLPLPDRSADFVFAHFPYWRKVRYSDDPRDLSRLGWEGYLRVCDGVFAEVRRILRPGRYAAVLIGDHREKGRLYDIAASVSLAGQRHLTLHDKIVCLTRNQRSYCSGAGAGRVAEWRARVGGYHLIAADYLLVFRRVER